MMLTMLRVAFGVTVSVVLVAVTGAAAAPGEVPFKEAPYGSTCGICEDVATTWSSMYSCKSDDPKSVKPTDCGFQCSMLCKAGEKTCRRSEMCEHGYTAIAANPLVAKYFWETGMCSDYNEYDQCMMAPPEVTEALGGLKCYTDIESGTFDHDTLVINHPECLQDPMCKAAQPNEGENMQSVRDECMACVWVAKTFPLFKEICKPDNVGHDCQAIVAHYGAPYRPDADLAGQGENLRRRRRPLTTATTRRRRKSSLTPGLQAVADDIDSHYKSQVFRSSDKHGIGSPVFSSTENRTKPTLENCLSAWYEFGESKFAQSMVQCTEPVMPSEALLKDNPKGISALEQCRCMCRCPYTDKDWLKLSSVCEYKPEECQLPNITPEMEKTGDPYQKCIDDRKAPHPIEKVKQTLANIGQHLSDQEKQMLSGQAR